MNQLSRIGIFTAVVRTGSFVGAARDLGITSSAVSKQVQNLERNLQVKLLNRTTRTLSVTEEGAVFFERAARALDDLREAQEQVYELKSHPRGPLKVSLPLSLGIKYLGSAVAAFARRYPEVELDVSLDDRFVDIAAEGFDLVVRIGALQDSSLIARRLASCPFVICASPAYLAQEGTPAAPKDLTRHNVMLYTRNTAKHEWRYRSADKRPGHVDLNGSFKCDSGEVLCEAALQGLGVALLPIFYVAEHLKDGRLHALLPGYSTWPARDIHAVFPPNRFLSTRLRLLVDHLTETCKGLPWE